MTTPDRQPARDGNDMQVASAVAAQSRPEEFAISPAIGGLPAIYVPQSPNRASTGAELWRATIRGARWAVRRAGHHLSHHHTAPELHAGTNPRKQEKP
jgi:hypothetical protein